jgi:hypothetical protein
MDEDQLIRSGKAYCNEQSRVFVRLCQISGIPARMIFLFYSDKAHGHVIAEFYADGRWCMADTSWYCVFPAPAGHLMNAAECHQQVGANRTWVGQAYARRARELMKLSAQELVGGQFVDVADAKARREKIEQAARELRAQMQAQTAESLGGQLWAFGVMDYPTPP